MTHVYFVSFTGKGANTGNIYFGMDEFVLDSDIRHILNLQPILSHIMARSNLTDVVILNYSLLRIVK